MNSNDDDETLDEGDAKLDICIIWGRFHKFVDSHRTQTIDGVRKGIYVCQCGTEEERDLPPENNPRPI